MNIYYLYIEKVYHGLTIEKYKTPRITNSNNQFYTRNGGRTFY